MNIEKLDEAIAYIEAHPEQHNQASWFERRTSGACGTTACLAGTVALLDGWEPAWTSQYAPTAENVIRDGETRHVGLLAAEILDLDDDQYEALFHEAGDLDGIKYVRAKIAAEIGAGPTSELGGTDD